MIYSNSSLYIYLLTSRLTNLEIYSTYNIAIFIAKFVILVINLVYYLNTFKEVEVALQQAILLYEIYAYRARINIYIYIYYR